MTASVKPNGQTKQVAGKNATGYDMEISMPATIGGKRRHEDDGQPDRAGVGREGRAGHRRLPALLQGGGREGLHLHRPARGEGLAWPGQGDGEMYKQFAATGGVPYEMEMNIKMAGEGPMAGHDVANGRHDVDVDRAVGRDRRARRRAVRAAGGLQALAKK